MLHFLKLALAALLVTASGASAGQAVLWNEQGGGLGLRSRAGSAAIPLELAFRGDAPQVWSAVPASDFALYHGTRTTPRLGLRAPESYGGLVYYLRGGWASSVEAGYAREFPLSPRRYSLSGQLHTALSEGRAISVGLKYRVNDADAGLPTAAPGELPATNGYTLTPYRLSGAGIASSYQLLMSYQHSTASTFAIAMGRESEILSPFIDPAALGSGPRQLTFTGHHWLTPSWALSYDLLSQDATSPLRLQGLRLGVRYRF